MSVYSAPKQASVYHVHPGMDQMMPTIKKTSAATFPYQRMNPLLPYLDDKEVGSRFLFLVIES
jgi:hypothetical protein